MYVWNYDIARDDFSGEFADEIDLLKYMLTREINKNTDGGMQICKGDMLYGPYINLPAGAYEVTVEASGGSGELCRLTYDCGEKELLCIELHEGDNNLSFDVDESINNFEIQCMCQKNNYVVNSIKIKRIIK